MKKVKRDYLGEYRIVYNRGYRAAKAGKPCVAKGLTEVVTLNPSKIRVIYKKGWEAGTRIS